MNSENEEHLTEARRLYRCLLYSDYDLAEGLPLEVVERIREELSPVDGGLAALPLERGVSANNMECELLFLAATRSMEFAHYFSSLLQSAQNSVEIIDLAGISLDLCTDVETCRQRLLHSDSDITTPMINTLANQLGPDGAIHEIRREASAILARDAYEHFRNNTDGNVLNDADAVYRFLNIAGIDDPDSVLGNGARIALQSMYSDAERMHNFLQADTVDYLLEIYQQLHSDLGNRSAAVQVTALTSREAQEAAQARLAALPAEARTEVNDIIEQLARTENTLRTITGENSGTARPASGRPDGRAR